MSKFLIIYSTTDGHTKKICQRIKNFLTDGNLVELLSLEDSKKVVDPRSETSFRGKSYLAVGNKQPVKGSGAARKQKDVTWV